MVPAITFVCQGGELEIKALLLAASLRRHLPRSTRLVAAIPIDTCEEARRLQPATREGLEALQVETHVITNPLGLPDYPTGYKMACLGLGPQGARTVFLDSDVLCLGAIGELLSANGDFLAKPADVATLPEDLRFWRQVYAECGLELPPQRVLTTTSRVLMPPYFNSGVLSTIDAPRLAAGWTAVAARLDRCLREEYTRPWLDQLALPVALTQLRLTWRTLAEQYNFPAHQKPLPNRQSARLVHYHWPSVLIREPRLVTAAGELAQRHRWLRSLIESLPEWRELSRSLAKRRTLFRVLRRSPTGTLPEMIVTGVPRAGTSYLCAVLHRVRDVVMINEPTEVFAPLQDSVVLPWGVAVHYRTLRRRILDGEAIENKVSHDKLIEDTASEDSRRMYSPRVFREDFLLGTKNTLAYLARLPQLAQVMPHAMLVASVRHPFDAIASWKTSFPHLERADVGSFPVGGVGDPWLAPPARRRLDEVAGTDQPELRRALLWRHLALLILEHRSLLHLVRYEDFVRAPKRVAHDLVARNRRGLVFWLDSPRASQPSSRREQLTRGDREAIAAICSDVAEELGYELLGT